MVHTEEGRKVMLDALSGEQYSAAVKWVIKWQIGLLGGFGKALALAIASADENNLARLEKGFPVEVDGYRQWTTTDLAVRLRAAGMEI